VRGGFVDKLMAGVYTFLPLGLRVVNKISNIIREEINAICGQEILMPTLHPIENYRATGRDNIDILFHTQLVSGGEIVLGQSHEEVVVPLVKKYVDSYRDLPLAVYQIQTKFRNELRPKSGIFRGREFLMKDLYSFHRDEADFEVYYKKARSTYEKVFARVGIGDKTYYTHASGGTFSKYSHEFQTLTDVGEDTIYICEKCHIAVNDEIVKEIGSACPQCRDAGIMKNSRKAIEVGNIFPLKTRYADPFGLAYKDENGENRPIIMGCYGIGISRLMGAIAELSADERGIVWPLAVAPFAVHVLSLSDNVKSDVQKVIDALEKKGVETLFDDREGKTPGERFSDADLVGCPWRVVVSEKTAAAGKIEIKKRREADSTLMDIDSFLKLV
ncbi:MAG: hypothetical protein HY470_01750, partial [Candidatus Ryanbacteria bacterium]|nr:hypothetical protein [Candidatus Ryanbacteria bacterium]